MNQEIRSTPVISATFAEDLLDGTIVKFSSGNIVKVTAQTDAWVGVSANNAVASSYATSGSVGNVIVRGSGAICELLLGATATKGALLTVSGSGRWHVGNWGLQTSGSSGSDNQFKLADAIALEAGQAGDIIKGVLLG